MPPCTQQLCEDYLAELADLVHDTDTLSEQTTAELTALYWANCDELADSPTPTAGKVFRIYARDYAREHRLIAPDGVLKTTLTCIKEDIFAEIKARETVRVDEDALVELAKEFLARSEIDYRLVQRPAQLEIGRDLRLAAKGEIITEGEDTAEDLILTVDEECRSIYTRDGEFVCSLDLPNCDFSETKPLLEWVGERMTEHTARIAGLDAEKAIYLERIAKMFDKRIALRQRAIKGLRWVYGPMGETFLREALVGSRSRSAMVGQLELKFTKERASTAVTNDAKAIAYVEAQLAKDAAWSDALAIKKSIMVSKIPKEALIKLPFDAFLYNPGGKDKFEMK